MTREGREREGSEKGIEGEGKCQRGEGREKAREREETGAKKSKVSEAPTEMRCHRHTCMNRGRLGRREGVV